MTHCVRSAFFPLHTLFQLLQRRIEGGIADDDIDLAVSEWEEDIAGYLRSQKGNLIRRNTVVVERCLGVLKRRFV